DDATGADCGFPDPRYGAALFEYDGDLYMFGGANRNYNTHDSERFSDLWQYYPTSKCWKPVVVPNDSNAPQGGDMLGVPLELSPGKWVFTPGIFTSNQQFILDMKKKEWTKLATSGMPPAARYGYATLKDGDEIVWINGAESHGCILKNPVIAYHMKNHTWRPISMSGKKLDVSFWSWCGVDGDSAVCLAEGDEALRLLDWRSKEWKSLYTPMSPLPRGHSAPVRHGDAIYMFGGTVGEGGYGAAINREFWRLNIAQKRWQQIMPKDDYPVARYRASGAIIGNKYYLFGGRGDDGKSLGDFWIADLSSLPGPTGSAGTANASPESNAAADSVKIEFPALDPNIGPTLNKQQKMKSVRLYNDAMKHYRDENYADSLELLKAAIEINPSNLLFRKDAACTLVQMEQVKPAVDILREMTVTDDCPRCYVALTDAWNDKCFAGVKNDTGFKSITKPASEQVKKELTKAHWIYLTKWRDSAFKIRDDDLPAKSTDGRNLALIRPKVENNDEKHPRLFFQVIDLETDVIRNSQMLITPDEIKQLEELKKVDIIRARVEKRIEDAHKMMLGTIWHKVSKSTIPEKYGEIK
ncbi:MAG: hypothetical protein JXX14_08670, partial [Deltaproteobacteria bacterium]|nr:hypothetical protein [Deltaproteobacteria bacterium]